MGTLETERLSLRPLRDSDDEPFYRMSMDPKVMEYLPVFPDKRAIHRFMEHLRADFLRQGWGIWGMERKEDGVFMGMTGMHRPGREFGIGEDCVEIGWRLSPDFWGKGYVTEAAREILRFGFDALRLPEILSFTALENVRSIGVMERLGMERSEKVFDLLLFPEGHPHRKHCIYRISQKKWRALRSHEEP